MSRTPACDAGTWVSPQFQSRVVEAVQRSPLAARASQAFRRDGCDGRRAEGLTIEDGDDEEEHCGSGGDSVGGDGDRAVALHQALVDEDPGEGDDQGEDDEQVSGEGGAGWIESVESGGLAGGSAVSAEGDERGAEGGDGEGEPAGAVHALVGEEGCADGKNDRHCAHHQRGVGDGGEGEAGELDEELEGDSEEGGEQKEAPVGPGEAGPMEQEQGASARVAKRKR